MSNNLIGTDPNQVPTNADLGTIAYQDAHALGNITASSANLGGRTSSGSGQIDLTITRSVGGGGALKLIGDGYLTGGSHVIFEYKASSGASATTQNISYDGTKIYTSGALELQSGAPTLTLNATGQATNKKKVRLAASQYTAGDFNIQQMNDNGTTIALTALTVKNGGNVGIGETSPGARLHIKAVNNRTGLTGTGLGTLHIDDGDTPSNNEVTSITMGGYTTNALGIIGLQTTNNGSNLFFGTSNNYSAGVSNTAMTIKYDGNVGIGETSPDYPLHIKHTTPLIYLEDSSSSGTAYLRLDGIELKLQNGSTNGPLLIATNNARVNYVELNGVSEIAESFHMVNNTQYDFEYTVPNEGGYGNSFWIIAGYNHHNSVGYGAHKVGFFSTRGTALSTMINVGDQSSGNAGAWQFSKPTATTLRIRKTAGTYGGSGSGFIKILFRNKIGV
jgi:hypothetical protein